MLSWYLNAKLVGILMLSWYLLFALSTRDQSRIDGVMRLKQCWGSGTGSACFGLPGSGAISHNVCKISF
jgi:hypothetical protein